MLNKSTLPTLFSAIDSMNAANFASFIAEAGSFRFGNWDPVVGRENIQQVVDGFYSSIKSLSHRLIDVAESENNLISRGEVTYTRHNGSTLTLPFCNFFNMEDGLVKHYQIYIDVSALYAE